jgi:hypothetical protein
MSQAIPIKKRIAPSVPLKLEMTDDNGSTFVRNFRVCFDFNVLGRIETRTGINMLGFAVWNNLNVNNLKFMLWSAILPNHPEFDTEKPDCHHCGHAQKTDEGLEALASLLDFEGGEKATEALLEAFLLYLPKEKAAALRKAREAEKAGDALPNADPPAATPATVVPDGSSSGPSLATISDSQTKTSAA